MDYGFDFTQNLCYISTLLDDQAEELKCAECPIDLEGRIAFMKTYLTGNDRAIAVLEHMDKEALKKEEEKITFVTKEEAFASYTFASEEKIMGKDAAIFEFHENSFRYMEIQKKGRSYFVHTVEEENFTPIKSGREKDHFLVKQVANRLNHGEVSTVFLVGEEFEGNWIELSRASLCEGRRVFMGNYLLSIGALYCMKEEFEDRPMITDDYHLYYWGIRAFHQGRKDLFIPILEPGNFWFATEGEIKILVDECKELTIEGQHCLSKEKLKIPIPLEFQENYPLRTTILKIRMYCTSARTLKIFVYDMGFGVSRRGKGILYQEEFKLPKRG